MKLLALFLLLLLTGCATTQTQTQIVRVPVFKPCEAAAPAVRPGYPALPIATLKKPAEANKVAEAYDDSITALDAYAKALNDLLDDCK